MCGLLHDIGIAGTLIALSEAGVNPPPSLELLWPAIDRMHAEASGMMTRLWGLASDVSEVVAHHHGGTRTRFSNPLIAALCLAESLADELDWGVIAASSKAYGDRVDRNLPGQSEEAARRLGVDRKLAGIRSQADGIAKKLGKPPA